MGSILVALEYYLAKVFLFFRNTPYYSGQVTIFFLLHSNYLSNQVIYFM